MADRKDVCAASFVELFKDKDGKNLFTKGQAEVILNEINNLKNMSKNELDFMTRVGKYIEDQRRVLDAVRMQFYKDRAKVNSILNEILVPGNKKATLKKLEALPLKLYDNKRIKYAEMRRRLETELFSIEGAPESIKGGSKNKDILIQLRHLTTKGSDLNPVVKDETAYKIALAFYNSEKDIFKKLNDAGLLTAQLDGYTIPQVHNRAEIQAAGKEEWVKFVKDNKLLDVERIFQREATEQEINDLLKNSYDSIVDGNTNFDSEKSAFIDTLTNVRSNMGTLKGKVGKQRKLHFKSGEALDFYNNRFGEKNLFDIMDRSMKNAAQHAAVAEIFGSGFLINKAVFDGDFNGGTLGLLKNKLKQEFPDIDKTDYSTFHNLMAEAVDYTSRPVDNLYDKFSRGMRLWNNVTMLGGTQMLAALTDPVFKALSLRSQFGGSLTQQMPKVLGEILNMATNPAMRKKIAEDMLISVESELIDNFERFSDAFSEKGGMIADGEKAFYALSGISYQTKVSKTAALRLQAKAFYEMGTNLDQSNLRTLQRFEITPDEWTVIYHAGKGKDAGGANGILSKNVKENLNKTFFEDPESVLPFIKDKSDLKKLTAALKDGGPDSSVVAANIATKYADKITEKYLRMLDTLMNEQVPTPDIRQLALLRQGQRRGTLKRTALDLWGQYKSFALKSWASVDQASKTATGQGFFGSLKTGQGAGLAVETLAYLTAAGYAVSYLRAVVAGREPPKMVDEEGNVDAGVLINSFIMGGGGGLVADIFLRDYTDMYRDGFWTNIAGPSAKRFEEGYKIFQGYTKYAFSGDEKAFNKAHRALFGKEEDRETSPLGFSRRSFLARSIPGNNLFYFQAGLTFSMGEGFILNKEPDFTPIEEGTLE